MRTRLAISPLSCWPVARSFFDAILDGFDLRVEQAGLHLFEQLLGGQQGVKFGGVEPDAGQLESFPILCIVVVV